MSWSAIARFQNELVRAARNLASWHAKCHCCRATGNGWSSNRAAPRPRSAGWLTRRENEIPASSKLAPPWKLRADSCPRWQEICPDTKKQLGLFTPANRNSLPSSFTNGPRTSACTLSVSSAACFEAGRLETTASTPVAPVSLHCACRDDSGLIYPTTSGDSRQPLRNCPSILNL